jgi:tRNA modification GTPase
MNEDTIAAIATPFGRGGIGIVRISGAKSAGVIRKIFKPERGGRGALVPRKQTLGKIRLAHRDADVDQALVTYFRKPASYTGEDVVEIACHGSPVILSEILETLSILGIRPARAGEFTFRAYLNGRLDLLQAEAVDDLIQSKTFLQSDLAFRQLGGTLSAFCRRIMEKLLDLTARAEANIDFSEENHVFLERNALRENLEGIISELNSVLNTYKNIKIAKEGLILAIIGRPNVGKSSLFNRLVNDRRAIVTHVPGTTRDYLEETLQVRGMPVTLVDTAGLRHSRSMPEQEAIEKTEKIIARAHLVLAMIDGSRSMSQKDRDILKDTRNRKRLVLINKIDLPPKLSRKGLERQAAPADIMEISLKTGKGVRRMKERVFGSVVELETMEKERPFLTSLRQKSLLEEVKKSARKALDAARKGLSEEFVLLDLHQARVKLGELTGETTVEDIYDRIFSSFCIGK